MKKGVCAIIVTYLIGKALLRCFDAIVHQVDEVFIVDNGNDEETLSVLAEVEKENSNVKVFYNKTNLGIAAALNTGIEHALNKGYTWILTLDHDSEAVPDMVDKLLDTHLVLSKQGVGNIAMIAANPIDISVQKYLYEQKMFNGNCEVVATDRVISSGSLINASVFREIGFFNESLFIYFVDDEFCLRCRNKDMGIYVCRSAILYHREGDKETRKFLWKRPSYNNYAPQARYYLSRNSVYMVASYLKSHKYRASFGLIRIMLKDIAKILFFESNKAGLILASFKGLLDGVRGKYGKVDWARQPQTK